MWSRRIGLSAGTVTKLGTPSGHSMLHYLTLRYEISTMFPGPKCRTCTYSRKASRGCGPLTAGSAKGGADDLPQLVPGQRRELEHPLGTLVAGQPRPGVRDEVRLVELVALAQHHPGGDLLAPPLVRDAGDRGLGHRRVGFEHDLHLARVDVQPAGDDHLLGPAADAQVPGRRVDRPNVAGAEPAVRGERGVRAGRVVPVPREHLWPAELDLAVRT